MSALVALQSIVAVFALIVLYLGAIWTGDRVIYWYGRRTGQIPPCTPGHCFCPNLCDCFNAPEDTQ